MKAFLHAHSNANSKFARYALAALCTTASIFLQIELARHFGSTPFFILYPIFVAILFLCLDDKKRVETSHQKHIQHMTDSSEKRIRNYAEAMPTMAFIANAEGRVIYFNKQWLEYCGTCHQEDYGWNWKQAIHPTHLATTMDVWTSCMRTGAPYQMEYLVKRHDGEYRWVLGRATPVRNSVGEITEWYGTNTDVHDLKTAQEDLRLAKEKAEQANSLKSTFLANMSHEIRTPMTAVLGFSELLRDPDLPDTMRKDALNRIERSGTALLRLIDDILDISKIEAGKISLEKARFSPVECLSDVVAILKLQAEQKKVTVRLNIDEGVPSLAESDPSRVRQVLTNVIGNAIKFTTQGYVDVRFKAEAGQYLVFEITDTGIGISETDQAKLFRPFAQADESITRQFGGTGLGLVLSRRLCQQMGGDLILQSSTLGQGSCFVARIEGAPFSNGETAALLPRQNEASLHIDFSGAQHPPQQLAGMDVLLVEDTPDNQVLMKRYLESAGAKVQIASDGSEAVQQATVKTFDLILMDIQMPQMDGFQAIHQLRGQGYTYPIVALTAHAMSEEIGRSLAAGFDDHLTKPIKRDQLITKVSQYRDRQPSSRTTQHPRSGAQPRFTGTTI